MNIIADTPEQYLKQLPPDRQGPMQKLRQCILDNLPEGFQEGMGYGMIDYVVPHSLYPKGYHANPALPLPFISIASQKGHIALYHFGLYTSEEMMKWFVQEYPKHSPLKLDMGKSCIRFKKTDQIPYELISELVRRMTVQQWIEIYNHNLTR